MLNTKNFYLKQLIYCCINANSTIAFLSEREKFLRFKFHLVWHTSLTFTLVKSRPKVNSEPIWHSWIMTFMNNGKTLPRLDGMACSYLRHDHLYFFIRTLAALRCFIFWDLQKFNLLENSLNNSRNNLKFQIKNKKSRSISLWNYYYQR